MTSTGEDADVDASAVLSDVEGDDDPIPIILPIPSASSTDILAELYRERQARKVAEDSRTDLQNSFNRLKLLTRDAIAKRDDAIREKEEATRKAESSRAEIESAAKMLVTGIDEISNKVRRFGNFGSGGLPRSEKYTTGFPAVAYGVVRRASQIVDEIAAHAEAVGKERDRAREQVEQRNYEIAIEVSQMEATIAGLREETERKGNELDRLERDNGDLARKLEEIRAVGEERVDKLRGLQGKLDQQRALVIEQLNCISRAHEQICEIVKNADLNKSGQSEFVESTFMWKEVDMDENLRTSLEGTESLCKLSKVAADKVREQIELRDQEVEGLSETVSRLVAEKKHIGTLLRSALSCNTNEVRQVAEDGLREAGIDFRFDIDNHFKKTAEDGEDEVYTLADALQNTVKASQVEIVELQHLVDALRAECSLLKTNMDAQVKIIAQQNHQLKELEERERVATENVEGLMIDIAASEEEIKRWKAAAEQEAAAGESIEQEFTAQMLSLQRELDEAKQAITESENKIKFKVETAAAAMSAREAAENSLKLADSRATRLRERLEELTHQLEESDIHNDSRNQNRSRYVCWPWQWLGLNYVGNQHHISDDIRISANEMELSEPLI